LPFSTKLAFHRGRLGPKIKHPARDEASEDGYVGDDYGYVVLDVVDAVVDRIRPVRLE
jgi:hypothetical protein